MGRMKWDHLKRKALLCLSSTLSVGQTDAARSALLVRCVCTLLLFPRQTRIEHTSGREREGCVQFEGRFSWFVLVRGGWSKELPITRSNEIWRTAPPESAKDHAFLGKANLPAVYVDRLLPRASSSNESMYGICMLYLVYILCESKTRCTAAFYFTCYHVITEYCAFRFLPPLPAPSQIVCIPSSHG